MTPACAEMTAFAPPSPFGAWDDPRVCGDDENIGLSIAGEEG